MVTTQDFTTHSKFKFNDIGKGIEMTLELVRKEMMKTSSRGVILLDIEGQISVVDIVGLIWFASLFSW